MKSKNLSYMFYKEYYNAIQGKSLEEVENANMVIFDTIFELSSEHFAGIATHSLRLGVMYPGMLIGTGYMHETGTKGEINLGFHFDYVTGVPVLPGSTLKGILRSAFRFWEYISELLEDICGSSFSESEVKRLELSIFGSDSSDSSLKMGGDVFFDVYPIGKGRVKLLDKENITPHSENIFASPNPLTFVKIKPETVMQFPFILTDSEVSEGKTVSAESKLELFKRILIDLGAGAKTNVGFGCLTDKVHEDGTLPIDICPMCRKNKRKFNEKNNSYYRLCWECNSRIREERAAGTASGDESGNNRKGG